jgi:hypothetical protein
MLRLLPTRPAPAAAPPALPPARAALAALLARMADLRARSEHLGRFFAAAATAASAEREALDRLDAVADLEDAALRQWVGSGALGPPPEPLVDERAAAATAVADAHQRAAQARRQADAATPVAADVGEEHRALAAQLGEAHFQAVLEVAQEAADRYHHHGRLALLAEAELNGLRDACILAGGRGTVEIAALLAAGRRDAKLPDGPLLRRQIAVEARRRRRAWAALPDRLKADPAAVVPNDDGDDDPPRRAA